MPVEVAKYFASAYFEDECIFHPLIEQQIPRIHPHGNELTLDYFLSSGAELNETIIIDLIN